MRGSIAVGFNSRTSIPVWLPSRSDASSAFTALNAINAINATLSFEF